MTAEKIVLLKETAGQICSNLFLITSGSLLIALAVNGILIPMNFTSGGFVGLSMLIHYFIPMIPLSLIYLGVNLPVYFMGYKAVGKRFLIYSLIGTALSTAAIQWVTFPIPLKEPIPGALLAGILTGLGAGLTLRSHGSSGGIDILSVILLKRFSIRLGTTLLVFNTCIMACLAMTMSLESAIYTLIYLFVSSHVMNLMVTGLSRRRSVMIISSKWREISDGIMDQIRRTATILPAQGAFSGKPENMIYTVVAFQELSRLKKLINSLDPEAFVVVSDTEEVMGHRIGNQPHW